MKKILIYAIASTIGLAAWTQSLSVDNVTLQVNKTGYINIQMTDGASSIAAGFYIELPKQIMVTDDASTALAGMSSNHIARMNHLSDSTMRLVIYSTDNSVFNFANAATQPFTLVCLPVKAGNQTGQFAAKLTGIEFAPTPNTFLCTADVDFTITVGGILGDVNGDGYVNIADVTSVIDHLLGDDTALTNTDNADVNNDGMINIADVTTIIDYLLNGSWN